MALVSAQRGQTLTALTRVVVSLLSTVFWNLDLEKSSVVISLPALPENEKLCVHSTLLYYVARTTGVRQSLSMPNKIISKSALSRWLKDMFSLAGIDTSVFKGHNFKGASASKAVSWDVSLADVFKTADWKNAGPLLSSTTGVRL